MAEKESTSKEKRQRILENPIERGLKGIRGAIENWQQVCGSAEIFGFPSGDSPEEVIGDMISGMKGMLYLLELAKNKGFLGIGQEKISLDVTKEKEYWEIRRGEKGMLKEKSLPTGKLKEFFGEFVNKTIENHGKPESSLRERPELFYVMLTLQNIRKYWYEDKEQNEIPGVDDSSQRLSVALMTMTGLRIRDYRHLDFDKAIFSFPETSQLLKSSNECFALGMFLAMREYFVGASLEPAQFSRKPLPPFLQRKRSKKEG